uniref:Reverse transcriptase domain-containing protein n=1 Tax=Tanacetum cinerariifolium TaxID=118510 RepID=A0A6L2MRT1_TANCI|nr:hypothetical protein [Tanacetum cinerariifolium]
MSVVTDTVMSDSEDSTVTYTEVSSPFEGLSDIGSLGVEGPPMMPEDPYAYVVAAFQAPPSPYYVPGPEEPEHAPPLPEFVPKPVHPEFMPPEDEILPAEEQPLPAVVSPTADLPGYIPKSDPEEDPTDYPTDRGDDDDDNDVSSDDDEGDDDDVEEDKEKEEHPAPADSIPPPPVHLSPPLPVSSPPLPANPTYPSGYRAAMIRLRAETPSTSHPLPSSTSPSRTPPLLPIPLPTSSPPLLLPSTIHRANVPEVTLPPQKRLCIALDYRFVATLDDEFRRDPERKVGYGVTDTWEEMLAGMLGAPTTDKTELGRRMTDFVTTIRQDTDEIYGRLDDDQDDIMLMSEQLNMLRKDRRDYARTARLIETKARLSRQAWVQSMEASDTAREVASLRTTVLAHQSEIAGLRAADCTRQTHLAEALTLLKTLQTQMAALQR